MFRSLGQFVARAWPFLLAAWVLLLGALWLWAPPWDAVGKSGQFAYLPADAPSRRAEALLAEAFPGQRAGSAVVLVVSRPDGELNPDDLRFVEQTLAPRLREVLAPGPDSIVARVRTPGDMPAGVLLRSPDRRAALVVAEFTTEFLDARNWPAVDAAEGVARDLRQPGAAPPGLEVALAGSAVLGRDTGRAEADSARAIERWTILVVVALLLLVYRAPLLAALPLVTVFVAVEVALRLLGLLAEAFHLDLFQGVRTYVMVVGYGAGVDYCLFLIARCREEWAAGAPRAAAVGTALRHVGAAITASAATVVVGVAMMGFARFGKIQQAGLGIAFGLVVVLAAALTFAPSLLCLTGRWALWPRHDPAPEAAETDGEPRGFWGWLGRQLTRRPGTIWLATVAALAPFAAYAVRRSDAVSYDLTRNVPADAPSRDGLRALREHFPAGLAGPVTVLVRNDRVDFRTKEGAALIADLSQRLEGRKDELGLADVRSLADPLGTTPAGREAVSQVLFGAGAVREKAAEHYVGAGGHVTRLDLVPTDDPFTEAGLDRLGGLERALRDELPAGLREGTEVALLGPGPGLRDLKEVIGRDEVRIDVLVVAGVFVVLLALLRRPFFSLYLILTVVFSYLVALGATQLVFAAAEPGFPGVDWKVPLFLFTILVAVGEDYNIFLLTRVREEEKRHGPLVGVTAALARTGGVITTCGLVMAGTFASLFAGSLSELRQMGFALAFGVLLDTLVVRPVLVPAFLILLRRWRGIPPARAG